MKPQLALTARSLLGVAAATIVLADVSANPLYVNSETGIDTNGPASNTCTSPDWPCKTIGHALGWAAAGDTIKLAGGVHYVANLNIEHELTIEADDANNPPTLEAENPGRHFTVDTQGAVVFQDLNLINGDVNTAGETGGSVKVIGGRFELRNSTASYNSVAEHGGAIACLLGCEELEIVDSTFESNSADLDGGAIYVSSNAAEVLIDSSKFRKNTAARWGGAVFATAPANVPGNLGIYASQFTANSADGGGALFSQHTRTAVERSSFVRNKSEGSGSAINFGAVLEPLILVNSTITGNIAGTGGAGAGAVYIVEAEGYWANLAFVDNESVDDGRHVFANNSSIEVSNSYFYTTALGLVDACVSNLLITGENNLWESDPQNCFDASSDAGDLTPNSLSPLGNYGPLGNLDGKTASYLLGDNSNALDAGIDCSRPDTGTQLTIDQRGAPRGWFCDIGPTEQGFVVILDLPIDF